VAQGTLKDEDYLDAVLSGRLDPQVVLWGYRRGIFPMADPDTGKIDWHSPDPRGIIDLDHFHIPHTLRSILHGGKFRLTIDLAFDRVIQKCGERDSTWISSSIIKCYRRLHTMGYAHSVESWRGEDLAGGLYGVSIGGAFFGESMFHTRTDGSKAALAGLVQQLQEQGFILLDVQFVTAHLARLGAEAISREEYLCRLGQALREKCGFARPNQQTIEIRYTNRT